MADLDELYVDLERFIASQADAFSLVTINAYTGDVLHTTGPFVQPEQALIQAGIDDADWRKHNPDEVEANQLGYIVVPHWEPGQ